MEGNTESALERAYGNLMTLCREAYGTEVRGNDDMEQICTLLTRQIRKVRECLTEKRRGK